MAKFKSVYFSESNPERWFETRDEADQFDKAAEIAEWLKDVPIPDISSFHSDVFWANLINHLMERYDLQERWDYKARLAEVVEDKED